MSLSPNAMRAIVVDHAFSNMAFTQQDDDTDDGLSLVSSPSVFERSSLNSTMEFDRSSVGGFKRSSVGGIGTSTVFQWSSVGNSPGYGRSSVGGIGRRGPRGTNDSYCGIDSPLARRDLVIQEEETEGTQRAQRVEYEEALLSGLANKENPYEGRLKAATTPAPRGALMKCIIKRVKDLLGGHHTYLLYNESINKFLLAARKRRKTMQSRFVISTNKEEIKRQSRSCISKFKASSNGLEYRLYRTKWGVSEGLEEPPPSDELCVTLSHDKREGVEIDPSDPRLGSALLAVVRMANLPGEANRNVLCVNKLRQYNEETQLRSLHFEGREQAALQSSVKNFQMTLQDHNNRGSTEGLDVVLQFGKLSREDLDLFVLDFAWPFSAHTAFAMALSAFDR